MNFIKISKILRIAKGVTPSVLSLAFDAIEYYQDKKYHDAIASIRKMNREYLKERIRESFFHIILGAFLEYYITKHEITWDENNSAIIDIRKKGTFKLFKKNQVGNLKNNLLNELDDFYNEIFKISPLIQTLSLKGFEEKYNNFVSSIVNYSERELINELWPNKESKEWLKRMQNSPEVAHDIRELRFVKKDTYPEIARKIKDKFKFTPHRSLIYRRLKEDPRFEEFKHDKGVQI